MKSNKGCFGYFTREKKRRLLTTVILFAIPLLIFFTALLYFKTRENIMTVVAVVGCLPACKSLVGLIMVLMRKSIPESEYQAIHEHAGDLTMIYELYFTSEEKNGYVDAFAICGDQVVGYSSDDKTDTRYTAELVQRILRQNGCRVQVKILKELNAYLDRLGTMQKNRESLEKDVSFKPDERYPGLAGNELLRHIILAIAL